jgi:hypothetical protein
MSAEEEWMMWALLGLLALCWLTAHMISEPHPRATTWKHYLRSARLESNYQFGPRTSASPGMVRCTLTANGIVVYDFEVLPETFVELAEGASRSARNISEVVWR